MKINWEKICYGIINYSHSNDLMTITGQMYCNSCEKVGVKARAVSVPYHYSTVDMQHLIDTALFLWKDFLFPESTSSSAVMEYSCNLLLGCIIYKNDIINHYGEGIGSGALQTLLSCEQPFLLSLNSIVTPPLRASFYYLSHLLQCSVCSCRVS